MQLTYSALFRLVLRPCALATNVLADMGQEQQQVACTRSSMYGRVCCCVKQLNCAVQTEAGLGVQGCSSCTVSTNVSSQHAVCSTLRDADLCAPLLLCRPSKTWSR